MHDQGVTAVATPQDRPARPRQEEARLRVGLVVEHFDPSRGGLEQWTYRFAREMLARGHELHVLSREFGDCVQDLPVVMHRLHGGPSRLAFAEQARAALMALELDVIHDMGAGWCCDVFQPHGGSWASLTDRRLRMLPGWWRRLKGWLNPLLPRQRQYQRLMAQQYADHGQLLVALSQSVAEDFQRFHHVGPERIRIVYNGVSPAEFSPERCQARRKAMRRELGVGPDTVLALVVAHNFRLKGIPSLLRAVARLNDEGRPAQLVVVGGKSLGRWRRRAAKMGIEHAVTFAGPASNPLDYYAAADLYVHPTFYDTCSLVVLEAAACGLPIITTHSNGAAELLEHNRDALLISDPADVGQLTAAMRLLLGAETRRRLGQAARETALRHTFQRNVDEILEVYREVIRRRGGLPRGYAIWQARVSAEETP